MKFFLDTEFIEADGHIDIISIGVVAEDGREFYAENRDVDWSRASQWVLDNVRPDIGRSGAPQVTKKRIGELLQDFVGLFGDDEPEFWAYYADYDWVALCSCFGSMIDLPKGWPMYCRDIKQWQDQLGLNRSQLPAEPTRAHHALADAHWVSEAWDVLDKHARGEGPPTGETITPAQFQASREEPKPLCIYHGNCADGFTAAWAVWKRFGDAFDYHAGIYQDPPPDVRGRHVVLVDFSYKRDVMVELRRTARSVLVLDHHKSAAEDLAHRGGNFGIDLTAYKGPLTWQRHLDNVWQDECENVGDSVYCLFDMERSGAGLAWDFFHEGQARPRLVDYAEDRDLWRFSISGSREVSAFIFSHEYSFDEWEKIYIALEVDLPGCVAQGAAIERKHHKDVAELVKAFKRPMTIANVMVWGASIPYTLTSDAGHLMAQGEPFAACYWDTPEGRVFSLRSTEGGVDVSLVAAVYGGGGHKHAAGFRISFDRLTPLGEPPILATTHVPAAA